MKKLRVAAYCRVSTDKDDQKNSLVSQREYFEEYIKFHNDWILDDIYYDEGISGTQTKKRAGFNSMISSAMKGGVDLILTKEVCRFARNTVDTLVWTRKLKDVGIGVIFTIDNIDTRDSDGELRLTIMASIAQEESRKTSERVKWGQKRRMEQGVVFGRDLLGYYVKDGVLSINADEAPVVRAIFHKYTNEGKGTQVIARELLEEGMRPKRTKRWNNIVILRVLRNEKYVGDLCQKKTYTPNYLTHAKKYNRGEEEKVYIYDHHEAIISRELWNRTQAELERRSPSPEQNVKYSNRYWCSGKIYCGACGNRFVSRQRRLKNGTVYRAWRCYLGATDGTLKEKQGKMVGCGNATISEKALLASMQYLMSHIRVNSSGLRNEILNNIKALQNTSVEESSQIEKRIETLNEKKKKSIDLALDGTISKTDLKEQTQWYDEQIHELEALLNASRHNDSINAKQVDELEAYIASLDEIMSFDESSQELYREMLNKIVVFGHPDDDRDKSIIEVYLKCLPFAIRMTIRSYGRNDGYTTEVLKMETVDVS